eukprot:6203114-Pleurochrysis_carterae.AAC.1
MACVRAGWSISTPFVSAPALFAPVPAGAPGASEPAREPANAPAAGPAPPTTPLKLPAASASVDQATAILVRQERGHSARLEAMHHHHQQALQSMQALTNPHAAVPARLAAARIAAIPHPATAKISRHHKHSSSISIFNKYQPRHLYHHQYRCSAATAEPLIARAASS